MTEEDRNALIRLPSGAIAKAGSGPERILSGMVSDALDVARSHVRSLTAARFRIWNYEFRDPDYRQILLWAEALELEPAVVVQRLERSFLFLYPWSGEVKFGLTVDDGVIVTLAWDFNSLPIADIAWIRGLAIRKIAFIGTATARIDLPLPLLTFLHCDSTGIATLDLSNVPALEELCCRDNQLTELDLSNIPKLLSLSCSSNPLTALDLSKVPVLEYLDCCCNDLTALDLSNVPELEALDCSLNQLTELNLSNVPALDDLDCSGNWLAELDLSNVPALSGLDCRYNWLAELDLSRVPVLSYLDCNGNLLTALDLSNVPELEALDCGGNHLTELDIRHQERLADLKHDPSVTLKHLTPQIPK